MIGVSVSSISVVCVNRGQRAILSLILFTMVAMLSCIVDEHAQVWQSDKFKC